ncbi:ubiquitin-specific protease ubp2, partial [Dissophora globulifera]
MANSDAPNLDEPAHDAWGQPGPDAWGQLPGSDNWGQQPGSDNWGEPGMDQWPELGLQEEHTHFMLSARELSDKGVTPPRWILDLAFHDVGLMAHVHLFYRNPHESGPDGKSPATISCSKCYKQYSVEITPGIHCSGLIHHLHTQYGAESTVSRCCHCGLTLKATLEPTTIPQSLLYRLRQNRRSYSNDVALPQFRDTLTMLVRILQDATNTNKPITGGINVDSNAFKSKIGMDNFSLEVFTHLRFSLDDRRLHPPESTPENIKFLNRCCFQLQLLLLEEAPELLADERDPKSPKIDMGNPRSLQAERHTIFSKLGCLSDMSDATIVNAFQTQVQHDDSIAHPLVDALTDIQSKRKSDLLDLEIVCRRSEGVVSTEELKRAYRAFEIPDNGEGISSEILVGLLRGSLHMGTIENVRIIAKARKDISIEELLEQPVFEMPQQQEEDPILDIYYAQNPIGLSNIGNTCYLNSLLQYLYTVREVRETVLTMEAYVENEDEEGWQEKVIDGRVLSRKDVAEAKEIVREMKNLFSSMESARTRSTAPSTRLVELLLTTGNNGPTETSTPRRSDQFFEQQDITGERHAAFRMVVNEKDGKSTDRFSRMFYVKANRKSIEENKDTHKVEERLIKEDFDALLLHVKDDAPLEELIDDYFVAPQAEETDEQKDLQGQEAGAGTSGSSGSGGDKSDITVTELPPLLQIHLIRTQFDRLDQTSYKSNATVSIPKRLYMDQYLDSNQEENADRIKKLKMWKKDRRECRRQLETIKHKRKLMKERALQRTEALAEATPVEKEGGTNILGEQIEQHDQPPAVDTTTSANAIEPATVVDAADLVSDDDIDMEEAEQLGKIFELTAQIQHGTEDMHREEYKIHAVFHHEGGTNFGHYWIYILDDQSDQPRWIKYSDDLVSEVGIAQESEVFQGERGSTACFCVYKRADVDPVQT